MVLIKHIQIIKSFSRISLLIVLLSAGPGMMSVAEAADPPDRPPKGAVAESMKVSPTKFEIQLKPGQETTAPIEISNGTRSKMTVTIATWNFARDDKGQAQPVPDKDAARFRGAAKWITHTRKLIMLEAGETTTTILDVKAPKEAGAGSYSAYVKVIGAPNARAKESLKVRYIINALVLPIVIEKSHGSSRALKTKVEFGSLSTNGSFHMALPVEIIAKVRNEGNVHQNFDGAIEVWQGSVRLTKIPLKGTLLPLTTATFIRHVEELPYYGKLTAKFSGSAFVAQASERQSLKGQTIFWYVPARFAYILVAIVLLLILGGAVLIRNYRTTKAKKSEDNHSVEPDNQTSED